MKKKSTTVLAVLLAIAVCGNLFLGWQMIQSKMEVNHVWNLSLTNGNSHDTYFSIHNVDAARKVSSGAGVRIGILDHYFGYEEHDGLYAGGTDFLDEAEAFNHVSEHGYWMTATLKEIAPDCSVYALNTLDSRDEKKKVQAMAAAIDWAIDNELDILTYSEAPIESEENRAVLDAAVEKAAENGLLTTFIHYDHPLNFEPTGQYEEEGDISIYNYDYNLLLLQDFEQYGGGNIPKDGSCMLYYSNSSMSPVTAGLIALLMSADDSLTPKQCADILQETAVKKNITDPFSLEQIECSRVADAGVAMDRVIGKE